MLLLCVVDVETIMIMRNRNHVKQSLEVGITIDRIEEFFKRNILELSKGKETIDEKRMYLLRDVFELKADFEPTMNFLDSVIRVSHSVKVAFFSTMGTTSIADAAPAATCSLKALTCK
jgi:hypothetical protein